MPQGVAGGSCFGGGLPFRPDRFGLPRPWRSSTCISGRVRQLRGDRPVGINHAFPASPSSASFNLFCRLLVLAPQLFKPGGQCRAKIGSKAYLRRPLADRLVRETQKSPFAGLIILSRRQPCPGHRGMIARSTGYRRICCSSIGYPPLPLSPGELGRRLLVIPPEPQSSGWAEFHPVPRLSQPSGSFRAAESNVSAGPSQAQVVFRSSTLDFPTRWSAAGGAVSRPLLGPVPLLGGGRR